jgi:hypothetical protein
MRLKFRKKEIGQIQGTVAPVEQLRPEMRVVIIDDKAFEFLKPIQRHGFKISQKFDVERIEDCEDYDVVICDIRGVGTKISPNGQGAHLAKEVKRRYPDKFVCVYTSGSTTAKFTDLMIGLDASYSPRWDVETWVEHLDAASNTMMHPYHRWLRTRSALLEKGVSLTKLRKLEDSFVHAVESGKPDDFQKAVQSHLSIEHKDVVSIALGVAQVLVGVAAL